MNLKNYFEELKRRNVFKASAAYLIVAWLIVQVASIVLPVFDAPKYIMKVILFILGIGFPINLVFSYIYDVTPEGLKKTENIEQKFEKSVIKGNRLNKVIFTSLSLVVLIFVINLFVNKQFNEKPDGEKSIAVLAFADMSPNKDQEYFSDGISEEILNLFAKIPELKVMSRTSSFSYKGKDVSVKDIGKELNVSHLLEGSIRKAGNKIRITVQLIKTMDGSHIWSETYDRDLDSIFQIQDDIAARVTDQLKTTLLGTSPKSKTVNIEAYNLFLQAKHLVHQNTKMAYISAEELTKKSIKIEPDYAASWELLASIYNTGAYNFNIRTTNEGIPLGLEAAEKAIELDPNLAYGYATLASLHELDWNFNESLKNINKALKLDPNNAIIISTAANMTYGDINKSIKLIQKSINLDPLLYLNYYNLGFEYYKVNELNKAEEAFRKFATYYPNSQILHYMQAMVFLAQGEHNKAKKEIELEKHDFFSLYGKNFVYYALGKQDQADALFEEFIEKYSETDPANLADLYAFRGEIDKSFYWLNRAVEIKDPVLLEALMYPSFKSLYKDPRWNTLINNMNLPKDHGYPMG
jgi:TolB-like protein/Tfp pilus assembly protein PilF